MVGQQKLYSTAQNEAFVKDSDQRYLSRKQRWMRYAFDCEESLVWTGWEPGGEYVKKLIIKNVGQKQQTFKFRKSPSATFSLPFSEPKKLSPGVSFAIPVAFRPSEHVVYEDEVEFYGPWGSFFVPLAAKIPTVEIEVPEMLDIGLCPVNEPTTTSFEISNTGGLPLSYQLRVDAPFTLSKTKGQMQPGHSVKINVAFHPLEASVYVGTLVCTAGEKSRVMKLSGIGKLPFLSASTLHADFGSVYVGQQETREVILKNLSMVRATMSASQLSHTMSDEFFEFTPKSAVIPPDSSIKIKMRYSPRSSDAFSSTRIGVECPAGNKLTITASGSSVGPTLELSAPAVNFGSCPIYERHQHVVNLSNPNTVAVAYHVQAEKFGMFEFQNERGVLPPLSSTFITVAFCPELPLNYYRRVFVLVQNGAPLALDLVGTGFDDKTRPFPFNPRHVTQSRAMRRTAAAPPLDPLAVSGQHSESRLSDLPLGPAQSDEIERQVTSASVWSEYFEDVCERCQGRDVTISESETMFGATSRMRAGDQRVVHIFNHTSTKMSATWVVPSAGFGEDAPANYKVFPEAADIGPKSSSSFRIALRPAKDETYAAYELECLVYPKTQRNFRLVSDESFVPPEVVSTLVSAHTFAGGVEHHLPATKLDTTTICFASCIIGSATYQTYVIRNIGDTPLAFTFDMKSASGVFSAKPASGLIQQKELAVIALRFKPQKAQTYVQFASLIMNYSAVHTVEIELSGVGALPQIDIENGGEVFIKPTCVGGTSSRNFTVRNPAQIAVVYEWQIPPRLNKMLQIEPPSGLLKPLATKECSVTFVPNKAKKYELKIPCIVRSAAFGGAVNEPSAHVTVLAEGSEGNVFFIPQMKDFKTVLVGKQAEAHVHIENTSSCSLYYLLDYEVDYLDQDEVRGIDRMQSTNSHPHYKPLLMFDKQIGQLPANCRQRINLHLCPQHSIFYTINVRCRVSTSVPPAFVQQAMAMGNSSLKDEAIVQLFPITNSTPIFQIVAMAMYPQLSVADVRCPGVDQSHLWSELSLGDVNVGLSTPLTSREVAFNSATAFDREPASDVLQSFYLNFRPSAVASPATVVNVLFKNNGSLPLEFDFEFPEDAMSNVEQWVEQEVLTEEQEIMRLLLSNKVFKITPSHAKLAAGETVSISFAYEHAFVGDYTMAVLLRVADGKQVQLLLTGKTLLPNEPYLHILFEHMYLRPVPIGLNEPVVQTIDIPNCSDVEASYEIDTMPMKQLAMENYEMDILSCLNPLGQISPNRPCIIAFRFLPIEAREYEVALPIMMAGASATHKVIMLHAWGFHPKQEALLDILEDAPQLPIQQLLPHAKQRVFLSQDHVEFGICPVGTTIQRIVVLYNQSPSKPYAFEWDPTTPFVKEGLIRMDPPRGVIQAGGHVVCHVLLTAHRAEFAAFDLRCDVEPWNPPIDEDHDLDGESGRGGGSSRRVNFAARNDNSPARAESTSNSQRTISASGEGNPGRGGEPGDSTLFLAVSVSSFDIESFKRLFGEEMLRKFYFQKSLPYRSNAKGIEALVPEEEEDAEEEAQEEKVMAIMQQQKETMSKMLEEMLCEVIEDNSIKAMFDALPMRETPFYIQLASRPPTPYLVTPSATPRDTPLNLIPTLPNVDRAETSEVMTLDDRIESPMQMPAEWRAAEAVPHQPPNVPAIQFDGVKNEGPRLRQLVQNRPDAQDTMHYILSSCLLNLMKEAAANEFPIDAMPRQLVANVEKLPS
jgi:hypothetical protein